MTHKKKNYHVQNSPRGVTSAAWTGDLFYHSFRRRTWLNEKRLHSSIMAATVVDGLARQAQALGPLLGLLLDVVVVMVVVVVGVVVGACGFVLCPCAVVCGWGG